MRNAGSFEALEQQKDAAYAERDRLVAALSKVFPAHLARHEGADWEDGWRNIVCIHLPAGQATWHIHDSEMSWFGHLETTAEPHWDGHGTEEKYRRLQALPWDGTPGTTCGAKRWEVVTHSFIGEKSMDVVAYCDRRAGHDGSHSQEGFEFEL